MVDLAAIITNLEAAGLIGRQLTIAWHAGEPLVLPPSYYAEAFDVVDAHLSHATRVEHCFQSNGILVNETWCRFIAEHDVRLGLSIDGPAWLHDKHRKTRGGRGTHEAVSRGIALLRALDVPFHAICVLTSDSLDHPDAIFDYFANVGALSVGFNIEEIEGANSTSSLANDGTTERFRAFITRIVERVRAAPGQLRIREIDNVLAHLRDPDAGMRTSNSENDAHQILSVTYDGHWSTFSPELLGLAHPAYGTFVFGHLAGAEPRLEDNPRLTTINDEIRRGVACCQNTCDYFQFCGGGAPANKLAETGRLDATETLHCRLRIQVVVDTVLQALERDLRSTPDDRGALPWFGLRSHPERPR